MLLPSAFRLPPSSFGLPPSAFRLFLMALLANGWTREQILSNSPHLTAEDIQAALHYAAETLKQEHVYPSPV
jgi:hypothetical protein